MSETQPVIDENEPNGSASNGQETPAPADQPQDISGSTLHFERSFAKSVSAGENLSMSDSLALSANAGKDMQVTDSLSSALVAGGDMQVTQCIAGAMVAGGSVAINKGGAQVVVVGGDLEINKGGAQFILSGGNVSANNAFIGVSFAQQTTLAEGSRVLLNTPQAIAFGAALGATLGLVSWLLKRRS
jgi:hypothetical protein